MAGLTYPYEFENNTTADGEQVQEQFDAVKDFLDDLGLSAATDGIPTSAIKQDNGLVAAHIANSAVGTDELATAAVTPVKVEVPTVAEDAGSDTGLSANTWTDTGAALTLSSNAFYIVLGTVEFDEAHTGSATGIQLQSRITLGGVTLDLNNNDVVILNGSRPVTQKTFAFANTAASTSLKLQARSNGAFTTVTGATTILRAIKLAG